MTTSVLVQNMDVQAQISHTGTRTYGTYNTRLSASLGSSKIIIGATAILIEIAARILVSNDYPATTAAGIWGGVWVSKP